MAQLSGYAETGLNVKVIRGEDEGTASQNLNRGIAAASYKVFCRLDMNCVLGESHAQQALESFSDWSSEFCAVGSVLRVKPSNNGLIASMLANIFVSPFMFGPSSFKASVFTGRKSRPSKSAYLGVFSTEDLISIGGFSELL